jgi:hypothetical protein
MSEIEGSPVNPEPANEPDQPANPGSRRTTRRQMLRGAAVTGSLAAAMYVKPNLKELGVPGAYAAVSPGLAPNVPNVPTGNGSIGGGRPSSGDIGGGAPSRTVPNTGTGGPPPSGGGRPPANSSGRPPSSGRPSSSAGTYGRPADSGISSPRKPSNVKPAESDLSQFLKRVD